LIIRDDNPRKFCWKIGCFGDDPNARFGTFRAGHDAANFRGANINTLLRAQAGGRQCHDRKQRKRRQAPKRFSQIQHGTSPWQRSRLVAGLLLNASLTKEVASVPQNLSTSFSAGETTAIQKGLLFRCGVAAERGIAMREPTEAADDVGMNFRPLEVVNISGCLVK